MRLDRHVAPAQHVLPLGLDGLGDQPLGVLAGERVARQEADPHAVAAHVGQVERHLGAQERVGQLDQDARAVAGVRVGTLGAAVLEVLERPQRA